MEFRPTLSLRWSQFLVPPPATPLQLPRGEPQPFLFPLQRTFQSALLWVTHVCHSSFLTLFPRLLLLSRLIWFQFLSAAFAQFGCFSKHRIPFFSWHKPWSFRSVQRLCCSVGFFTESHSTRENSKYPHCVVRKDQHQRIQLRRRLPGWFPVPVSVIRHFISGPFSVVVCDTQKTPSIPTSLM